MLLTVEAGIFPLLCGWWMDICSFVRLAQQLTVSQSIHPLPPPPPPNFWQALLGSNLSDRQKSFSNAPGIFCLLLAGYSNYMYHLIPSHFLSLPPPPSLSPSQALSCFSTGCQGWCSYSTLLHLLFSFVKSFVPEYSGFCETSMTTTFTQYKM